MNNIIPLLLSLFLVFQLKSQTTNIPDPNFETAIIQLGLDTFPTNGTVPTANIDTLKNLFMSNLSISDLTGIEDFQQLSILVVNSNDLTTVDLSQNALLEFVDLSINELSVLDVSNNTALKSLLCELNQLTSINVENNLLLEALIVSSNQLTSIDVAKNKKLQILRFSDNMVASLDASENNELISLSFHNNALQTIDVSKNPDLFFLGCENNQLTNIDLSQNPEMESLFAGNNQLEGHFDVSSHAQLERLSVEGNSLSTLNVQNGRNGLMSIVDATNNPMLSCIQVDNAEAANNGAVMYFAWSKDVDAMYSENCAVGIADLEFNEMDDIHVYPNPVMTSFSIDSKEKIVDLSLYSLNGNKVRSFNSDDIDVYDVADLQAGVYVLKVIDSKHATNSIRFIKN